MSLYFLSYISLCLYSKVASLLPSLSSTHLLSLERYELIAEIEDILLHLHVDKIKSIKAQILAELQQMAAKSRPLQVPDPKEQAKLDQRAKEIPARIERLLKGKSKVFVLNFSFLSVLLTMVLSAGRCAQVEGEIQRPQETTRAGQCSFPGMGGLCHFAQH